MHRVARGSLTTPDLPETVSVMKLSISGDIDLGGPSAHAGDYITWLEARAGATSGPAIATARIALVHVGEIADAHGDIWRALRGTSLESIHDLYFSQGWYKDDFDGAGIDLLFVERVVVDEHYRGRNLDLAVVRRLCDTLGSGCQLAVMPYRDPHEAAQWGRLGFALTTPGRSSGMMHMKLGYRHARVVDANGSGHYEVYSEDVPPPSVCAYRPTTN
jgi:hypothetical protein